jgi:hypothetical protein
VVPGARERRDSARHLAGLRRRLAADRTGDLDGLAAQAGIEEIGDWRDWPWSLMDYLPSAARAAGGCPSLIIWHFQLPAA